VNELILKDVTEELKEAGKLPLFKIQFPTVNFNKNVELVSLTVNDLHYGYICLEYQIGICVLHLHIFKEHRSKEKIGHLVKGFTDVVHPWVRNRRANKIMVQCDYEDTKTMELFKTFGYVPFAVWVGIMEI
jgi:hypothetical protein